VYFENTSAQYITRYAPGCGHTEVHRTSRLNSEFDPPRLGHRANPSAARRRARPRGKFRCTFTAKFTAYRGTSNAVINITLSTKVSHWSTNYLGRRAANNMVTLAIEFCVLALEYPMVICGLGMPAQPHSAMPVREATRQGPSATPARRRHARPHLRPARRAARRASCVAGRARAGAGGFARCAMRSHALAAVARDMGMHSCARDGRLQARGQSVKAENVCPRLPAHETV
jgi:hypothetical protein